MATGRNKTSGGPTSVFHSISNRARGKHSRNSISSVARYAFNSFF